MMHQQHHAAESAPFGLTGTDELVDDDLCAIDEVAKLPFPDDQRAGIGRRIPVLEPEHRFLG